MNRAIGWRSSPDCINRSMAEDNGFFWDKYDRTSMGRYLFTKEFGFIQSLARVYKPVQVLDVGCGSGRIALPLLQTGVQLIGLDPDPVALASFRQKSGQVPVLQASGTELPFPNLSFEWVITVQAFMHMEMEPFFREVARVLKPQGLLVFDMLNRHSYKAFMKQVMRRTYSRPSAGLSFDDVVHSLKSHGFDLVNSSGFNWIPFFRKSNSYGLRLFDEIERTLRLERLVRYSPSVLIAARKA